MTRVQAAEVLGIRKEYVQKAFEAACKEDSTLDRKNADYTLEEMLFALQFLRTGKGLTEVEKIILEEDFFMNTTSAKAIGIDGTEEFLEKIKHRPKRKCCATCTYCIKSTIRNNRPTLYPYCNFFERYLHLLTSGQGRKKVDVYNDYCKAWEYSNKEPLIFYKADSPSNLDIYGNVKNEVMGFDVKEFGKKSESGLITDIGMEIPDVED